jgi:hypothetical protein
LWWKRLTRRSLGESEKEEMAMRFMLTFRVPPEVGNTAMKDGRFMSAFQSVVEELKPEAAYFTPVEGARGGYLIVNMDDASQIPAIAEPLFLGP